MRTRVAISDWCASRKVVSVMSRRFCLRDPLRQNFSGAEFEQQLPGARRRRASVWSYFGSGARRANASGGLVAFGVRVAVDDDVCRGSSAAWSRGPGAP